MKMKGFTGFIIFMLLSVSVIPKETYNSKFNPYFDAATARNVFSVILGADFWFRFILEVELHCLYLLVTAARLVRRVLQ